MGLTSKIELKEVLDSVYLSASEYYPNAKFLDSSNKLSHIAPLLKELYPHAKFIHLTRDGRKVVSSFYNKLGRNIYTDYGVGCLSRWIADPSKTPPPLTKNSGGRFRATPVNGKNF
jgi:hypothetical protein